MSELTVIGQQPNANQAGLGMDFTSRFFNIKPDTISINQPNTQVEGAIKGHLRLSKTGDQFKEMHLVLLVSPTESRDCYMGEPGQLNRTQENLMCFSRDLVRPDAKAKVPQAMLCGSCSKSTDIHANWARYEQTKAKADIPACERTIRALFLDVEYEIPLQMFFRSTIRKAFEAELDKVVRKLIILRKNGTPNIFDLAFTLSTRAVSNGKTTTYVPKIDNVHAITPEQRESFRELYLVYKSASERSEATPPELLAAQASTQVDALATGQAAAGSAVEGEYVTDEIPI